MNSLNFKVNYKFKINANQSNQAVSNKQKESMFRRNLNNELTGIKLPEMIAEKNLKIMAKQYYSSRTLK